MDSFGIEGYFFACESNFDRSRLHLSLFLLDFSSNFTNTESPYAMEEKNSEEKMEGGTLVTRRIGQTKVKEKGGKQRKKS